MRTPPRAKLPMRYDQELRPPFLVTQMPSIICMWDIETLEQAIDEFVRYCLPPSYGGAGITDSDGVMAIAYTYDMLAEDSMRWTGVRAAVDLLRAHRLVEPALMVSIEMALEPA